MKLLATFSEVIAKAAEAMRLSVFNDEQEIMQTADHIQRGGTTSSLRARRYDYMQDPKPEEAEQMSIMAREEGKLVEARLWDNIANAGGGPLSQYVPPAEWIFAYKWDDDLAKQFAPAIHAAAARQKGSGYVYIGGATLYDTGVIYQWLVAGKVSMNAAHHAVAIVMDYGEHDGFKEGVENNCKNALAAWDAQVQRNSRRLAEVGLDPNGDERTQAAKLGEIEWLTDRFQTGEPVDPIYYEAYPKAFRDIA